MDVAIIGLGRMGAGVAKRLAAAGHAVVAYNRTVEKADELAQFGIKPAHSIEEIFNLLPGKQRILWLYLPAGEVTEEHIAQLTPHLQEGDYILDGGNSRFSNSVRHAAELKKKGVHFFDVGTSGGLAGATVGYCLMVGGDKTAYPVIEPLLGAISQENGYGLVGPAGAGHYVKMVHNGIEYGMMQAYGEGVELIKASQFGSEIAMDNVSQIWQHGSIIRSYLGELLAEALQEDSELEHISGKIDDNGEGKWTVEEALDNAVPLPVITAAMFARYESRRSNSMGNRVVAILRNKFGGHKTYK